mmetsp:Transcript_59058/g.87697  ORF Transcript_59058/g.87697 Transcript_59058/m.87697 type:complete len:464 (-) Transcript_59058:261-1652(-)
MTEINDWSATCSIYDICDEHSSKTQSGDQARVSLDLPMGIRPHSTVLIRPTCRTSLIDNGAGFGAQLISSCDDIPVLHIIFHYSDLATEERLVSVKVSFSKYPAIWPQKAKKAWLRWLNDQASEVLVETRLSYAICGRLEHSSIDFFDVTRDTNHEFTAVVCLEHPLDDYDVTHLSITVPPNDVQIEDYQGAKSYNSSPLTFAEDFIISKWREWVYVECPICFDNLIVANATDISCGHLFCADCISMYARTTLRDLKGKSSNPFKCPVTSCRRNIKLVSCVKKMVSKEEWEVVELWREDIKYPPATMLKQCLRKSCGEGLMRHESPGSPFIYCDHCKWMCCELCLRRPHRSSECDQSQIIRLCARYRVASDKIKEKCENKWPWIKEYSISRDDDADAVEWVKANASFCPKCSTGIERSAGCFHMVCADCETHFCYECGVELSFPYYGTHHCWEERNEFQLDDD